MKHARKDYERFQDPAVENTKQGGVIEALAFAKSVIQSGEKWTATCEQVIGGALQQAIDQARLPEGCRPIAEDEPVILFRASDENFVGVLYDYRKRLMKRADTQPAMLQAIDQHIGAAQVWQMDNGKKQPDMPPDAIAEVLINGLELKAGLQPRPTDAGSHVVGLPEGMTFPLPEGTVISAKVEPMKFAPWAQQQVDALNAWQECGYVHEFNCPQSHEGSRVLVATLDGWKCRSCTYTQNWAHEVMFNGPPPHPFPEHAAQQPKLEPLSPTEAAKPAE